MLAEAAPLPAQDGVGRHDHEGRSPPRPHPGQADPEEPLAAAQLRPVRRSLVHGELLAQGEVLEGELAVAAAEEREEAKQVEQRGDHGAAIVSGSEPRDQPLVRRTGFWRRTGFTKVKTAPRCRACENSYVERLIGTLRRECLDHVVMLNDTQLRRLLRNYLTHYHGFRTHLSLEKDAPEPRLVEHPDQGRIVEIPMVGGLHHRYTRQAA